MELFDEWMSSWCIGSVFPAPQLITGPSAQILGPLLFDGVGDPLLLLSTGNKPDSFVQRFSKTSDQVVGFLGRYREPFIPYDVLDQFVAEDMHMQHATSLNSNQNFGNRLQGLKWRDGTVQLFFPDGVNKNQIGSVFCSQNESKSWSMCRQMPDAHGTNVLEKSFCPISSSVYQPILELAVMGRDPLLSDDSTEGFLLARTAYAVHWFRAESREGFPMLSHLAVANFKKGVSHACWNPHLPEESAVILENGELRLFDISSCGEALNCPVKLSGRSLPLELAKLRSSDSNFSSKRVARKKFWQGISELDFQNREELKEIWWHCEYGWHPRTLLVAGWNEIQLVDFRTKKGKSSDYSSVLAKANLAGSLYCNCPSRKDRFVAFARADYDMFQFAVASKQHVLLFDSRQPLTPILQWEHGLKQSPAYLQMCRLSELRTSIGHEYKWASDSGYAILATSFKAGEIRVFCYGPRPLDDLSLCKNGKRILPFSDSSDIPDVLYAWEHPSKIFIGNGIYPEDNANDLDAQNNLHSTDFLYSKFSSSYLNAQTESISGLCIISDQPSIIASPISSDKSEESSFLGFSLMHLTGAGDLVSQQYQASRKLTKRRPKSEVSSGFITKFMTPSHHSNLDYPKSAEHIYRRLLYFAHYLKSGYTLEDGILSSSASCLKHNKNERDLLKSSGQVLLDEFTGGLREANNANMLGTLPPLNDILHHITIPCSIYEISLQRLWLSLPMDLLELAVATYSDLCSSKRNLPPDFLQIFPPDYVRMPVFHLQNLQIKSEHHFSEQNDAQILLGPILPLPFLLALQQKEMHLGSIGESLTSGHKKIKDQCQLILNTVENLKKADLIPEVNGSTIVSLADDRDIWPSKHDMKEDKYLLLHEPLVNPLEGKEQSLLNNGSAFGNAFEEVGCNGIVDRKVHDKFIGSARQNFQSEHDVTRPVMSELDHSICPIHLSFIGAEIVLDDEELKGLEKLKQQCYTWQQGFDLYQNYLSANVYRNP